MQRKPNLPMTRSRFAAYVAILIVAVVLILNLDFLKVVPAILVFAALLIMKAVAIPFLFGFILQGIFYRKNIPKVISLLLAIISMISLWYYSGYRFLGQKTNIFIELFLLAGSIIVVKGCIVSGAAMFQKIRDKHMHGKLPNEETAKEPRDS